MQKAKEALLEQIKGKVKEQSQKESIKERLIKASDMAKAQMELEAAMEQPSKNALHSRYKNGLYSELQDMEQQKLDLLSTILAEGFDPMITVINKSGVKSEIPLSSYVNDATGVLKKSLGEDPSSPPTTPEDPTQPRKVGNFIVYKGGKDDGTVH